MTFARALIIASMTACLVGTKQPIDVLVIILCGWTAWHFTDDPLPGAIERGLDAYRGKHQQ